MVIVSAVNWMTSSRAPYGARGLKCCGGCEYSLSYCRAPYGARGLKCPGQLLREPYCRRAPYGARGLKFSLLSTMPIVLRSRPVWGAWIEIQARDDFKRNTSMSRPVWGAWIEISAKAFFNKS